MSSLYLFIRSFCSFVGLTAKTVASHRKIVIAVYTPKMDSEPPSDGYLIDLIDNEWLTDELPHDQITVPFEKLPDPEADNGDSHLTLTEQEQKWTDLAFSTLAPELSISDQLNMNGV